MVSGCREGCQMRARVFLGAQGGCRDLGSFVESRGVSALRVLNHGATAVLLENRPVFQIARVVEGCNLTCLNHCEKGSA